MRLRISTSTHTYHSTGGEGAKEGGGNKVDTGARMTGPRSRQLVRQSSVALNEAGRGSVGPVVGLGRRKDKHSYPRPKAEEEDNVNHGAHQRGARHEETIGRTHHCADAKKGAPVSNGTTPGASSRIHCMGRGRQDIYGTDLDRVCKVDQR
jgi:hypothetical protein